MTAKMPWFDRLLVGAVVLYATIHGALGITALLASALARTTEYLGFAMDVGGNAVIAGWIASLLIENHGLRTRRSTVGGYPIRWSR